VTGYPAPPDSFRRHDRQAARVLNVPDQDPGPGGQANCGLCFAWIMTNRHGRATARYSLERSFDTSFPAKRQTRRHVPFAQHRLGHYGGGGG
jgi:hypothetical protein